MNFLCRVTDHELSRRVLEAFCEGTPGTKIAPLRFVEFRDIPVYYGILRGCKEQIRLDMMAGNPWVYIDHGYFGDNEPITGHYRIVVGGLHHRVPEWPKPDHRRPLFIADERKIDYSRPMVIVPPSEYVADFYGIDVRDWLARFTGPLSPVAQPPVIVSTKADGNLESALNNSRGLFTHSSTAAVTALTRGFPAWSTAELAPVPLHGKYDRVDLLHWLAERQFTLKDIRNGKHLVHLQREVESFSAKAGNPAVAV